MNISVENFEKEYLGKEVKICFFDFYVPYIGKWIENSEIFKGKLLKRSTNYYYLDPDFNNAGSSLYNVTFLMSNIKAIKVVEDLKLSKKKK